MLLIFFFGNLILYENKKGLRELRKPFVLFFIIQSDDKSNAPHKRGICKCHHQKPNAICLLFVIIIVSMTVIRCKYQHYFSKSK